MIDAVEVRALAASWRVWVTLQVPWTPMSFLRELNKLSYLVNQSQLIHRGDGVATPSNQSISVSSTVQESWLGRLRRIKQNLPRNYQLQRTKRGLFDAIGELAHGIIGVATDREVKEIREVVDNLHGNEAAIVHQMELLTSVVNRSRVFLSENRERINEMNRRFQRMEIYIPRLESKVDYLMLMVEFERIIEDMETKWDALRNMQELYLHRRHDLQAGRLTEQLLPVSALTEILSKVQNQFVSSLDMNWYYSHTKVRALWGNEEYLVFEVMLPLIRPAKFILYKISTWPVPITDSTSATVRDNGDYGYDTLNGELFPATECEGERPVVCHADPVWGIQAKPCIRGILTNNHKLMDKCELTLRKGNVSVVHHVQGNEYVLSTWGESVKLRCDGQHPSTVFFSKGVHDVIVQSGCNLYGDYWTLKAISVVNSSINIPSRQLPRTTPLNLTNLITPAIEHYTLPIELNELHPIAHIPIELIKYPSIRTIKWSQHGGWLAWILAGVGLLLVVIVSIYGMYKQERCPRRCNRRRYTFSRRPESSKEPDIELSEREVREQFLASLTGIPSGQNNATNET